VIWPEGRSIAAGIFPNTLQGKSTMAHIATRCFQINV